METYQIHIARGGQETLTHACLMASDYAAIRHARNLADNADHISVAARRVRLCRRSRPRDA